MFNWFESHMSRRLTLNYILQIAMELLFWRNSFCSFKCFFVLQNSSLNWDFIFHTDHFTRGVILFLFSSTYSVIKSQFDLCVCVCVCAHAYICYLILFVLFFSSRHSPILNILKCGVLGCRWPYCLLLILLLCNDAHTQMIACCIAFLCRISFYPSSWYFG